MLPTLCNTAPEYIGCLWSLVFQPQILRYQWERKEGWEVQHTDHTPKKKVLVDNLTVCAKVITHIKKHPVGDSGSNLVYLELGFGLLQTASNQTCSTTHGHLCKSILGLNESIGGGNHSWHLHLAWVWSDGRMKIHNRQSCSKQNWFNWSGPAN